MPPPLLRPASSAKTAKVRDTSDVGVELRNWVRAPGALHCQLVGEEQLSGDFVNFVFRLFVVRRYHPQTWLRLVPGIPPAGEPDWKSLQYAFREAYSLDLPIFQTNFRPTTLHGHCDEAGQWHCARQLEKHKREELTLRLLYQALPRQEIQNYAAEACPRTFAAMIDKMEADLGRLRGVFGNYGIKIMLDMLVMTGSVPREAISRWPVDCPGYQATLAALFPGLDKSLHLKALYWVHRQLCGRWRFEFPESCAQLYWDHRRVNGTLKDRYDGRMETEDMATG